MRTLYLSGLGLLVLAVCLAFFVGGKMLYPAGARLSSTDTVKLSNGVRMPILGLGTSQGHGAELYRAVHAALDAGYRLIDTAHIYANEEDIGAALADYFATGKLNRTQLFVSTKLWANSNKPTDVEAALRESLRKLKLSYVDMYLVHMPAAFSADMKQQLGNVHVEDTWKAMESVYSKGLTHAIGVSNFNASQIQRVIKVAHVPIHNLQLECHVHLPQLELQKLAHEHNISFTAYAPLGSPASIPEWRVARQMAEELVAPRLLEPLKNDVVLRLAQKYGKTPAQILIRHLLQQGMITVPKSVHEERVRSNFKVFDFQLTGGEVNELNNVRGRLRLFRQEFMIGHPEDPFHQERH